MIARIIVLFFCCCYLACSNQPEAPPPEKGLILDPKTDTLPEREVIDPNEDDDLGRGEVIEEEDI